MKKKIIMLCMGCFFVSLTAKAQWVVTDPTNLAQGIINAAKTSCRHHDGDQYDQQFSGNRKDLQTGKGIL